MLTRKSMMLNLQIRRSRIPSRVSSRWRRLRKRMKSASLADSTTGRSREENLLRGTRTPPARNQIQMRCKFGRGISYDII